MNDYLKFLDGRVSVRQFDPDVILSNELIKDMLEHASYAPSGNNFQPWRVVVITNKEKQAHLTEFTAGQLQVKEASAVFLLFGDKSAYDLEWWQDFHLRRETISKDKVADKLSRMETYFKRHPEDRGIEGLRLDVGLFAMNLMHVVRAFGYDSVPMRGVDFNAIKTYLNISDNWEPILLLPVGKALQTGHQHVRKSVAEFAEIIE